MPGVITLFQKIARDPGRATEIVLCLLLIVGGIFIMIPQSIKSPTSSIGVALVGIPLIQFIFGIFYILAGIPGILAASKWIKNPLRLRSLSTYSLFLIYLFSAVLRIVTFGIFPVQWLSTVTLAVIAAICHIKIAWDRNAGN